MTKCIVSFEHHYLVSITLDRSSFKFNDVNGHRVGRKPICHYEPSNDLYAWCRENNTEVPLIDWMNGQLVAHFNKASDAVLFKLSFAG